MQPFLEVLKNPPWDMVLIFMLVAFGFFWGISGGKKKMALMMLGIYVLLVIFPILPVDSVLGPLSAYETFMLRSGIFLSLLLFLTLFLSRAFKGYENGPWWRIILLSILAAGFLTMAILTLAPPEMIERNILNLSPAMLMLFADPLYVKWWTIIPIFGIIFL